MVFRAADAASHLFFAYLRSISPDAVKVTSGIHQLPISLRNLMNTTEYPPITPLLMQTPTTRVAMIVDSVSPTPFALLRRAKRFEFRFDDRALTEFAEYEDPVRALTDECRRVLRCISSTNQSTISSSGIRASWSRFEDIGFSGFMDESDHEDRGDSLEPGELASTNEFDLDDCFWWVWMTSLAGEETAERKAAFGRCVLVETTIPGGRWLVVEEMVKSAAATPVKEKSKFGFTRSSRH